MKTIGTQLSLWLRHASRNSLPAPMSASLSLFSSSAKKQVQNWFKTGLVLSVCQWWLIFVVCVCVCVCLLPYQMQPVREIDGTTSPDIFTVLSLGMYTYIHVHVTKYKHTLVTIYT